MTNRGGLLRPGMLVNALIGLEKRNDALLVPVAALVKEHANTFVFTFGEGKARKAAVKIGFNDGRNVKIASGMKLEDLAILTSQPILRDGQPVRAVETK